MAMLSKLLINDYIAHYGITNKTVAVDCKKVSRADFDLKDMPSPFDVLSFGAGEFSLKGNNGSLEVVHYEDFVNQCKKPLDFSCGRKRCDYILCSADDGNEKLQHVMLVEITSALGSVYNLRKPIIDKSGNVQFEGGKFEKGIVQLGESLRTLMDVPKIDSFFCGFENKQCLLSYRIKPYDNELTKISRPKKERYLKIEAAETQGKGAVLADKLINRYGFTFRRLGSYYKL